MDAFQRQRIILALDAIHTVADFLSKILHCLQIVGATVGVFLVLCTKVVEGTDQW